MRKIFTLILLIFCTSIYSQIGGRLKEVQNQRKLKRTIFKGGWKERKWQPHHLKRIEPDRKLFHRSYTVNERKRNKIQRKINRKRERIRLRSRNRFHKRKYHRF